MTLLMYLLMFSWIFAMIAVASSSSPYFAALGLVVVAGSGCGILLGHGGSFLCLVLFLIYLGGMLVVFAYSAALAAEPHPETLGSEPVLFYAVEYLLIVVVAAILVGGGWCEASWVPGDELSDLSVFRVDMGGVAFLYSLGGGMLIMGAWVLLLTLFVVLEITRGLSRGTLRAV
uniref:NADH-ubiquinone oxidoreductase chain 6 n=1 Tax=Leiopotherapon unicolor TaxID=317033 RepID=A0A4Y6A899_LEIUN|nr:NADH dehydrogenase subunit 6 [Leiopotherapon unicolor]QDE53173.1 NADH dehydrogenase subunit 6 [Leiopotherapon unicolor]WRM53669.1 NADH dehydrogenase subunit 6 [Leiopotherapon unicolor]